MRRDVKASFWLGERRNQPERPTGPRSASAICSTVLFFNWLNHPCSLAATCHACSSKNQRASRHLPFSQLEFYRNMALRTPHVFKNLFSCLFRYLLPPFLCGRCHLREGYCFCFHHSSFVLLASNTKAKGREIRASDGLIRYVSIIDNPKNVTIGSKSLSSCNNISW